VLALAIALVLAQPTPFHTVKYPEVDPTPWRGGEVFELLFTDEGRIGPPGPKPTWKREATAILKVRKTAEGFALTLRRSGWWWGGGPSDCSAENLVHVQDQDVTLDPNGQVAKIILRAPPSEARALAACPDREKAAAALWNTIALLAGAAKQRVFSHKRLPMTELGPDGFLDYTVSYQSIACRDRTPSCCSGNVEEHYLAGPKDQRSVDRTTHQGMTLDPDGGLHYFHRSRTDQTARTRTDLGIVFRPPRR
jgi:hypothetical protein